MEARNFVTAHEMVHDGHWLRTTMNGAPRYEKPPLPTWLSAGTGSIFSFDNLAALRFPAAASALLLVLYFFKITELLTANRKVAFISSLVLAANYTVIYVGKRANWDIYSYSFMVMGLYYFALALKERRSAANFVAAGLLFGLSVLSKGPTGPYVLFLPFFGAYLLTRKIPSRKVWLQMMLCAAVAAVVGLSWYFYIYMADGDTFISIMEKEALARENRDVKPFTRYLSFPVHTGVWALFSVVGLFFPYLKKRIKKPSQYMFFFYWTVFSLVLLSLVPSKKERYLFPMMIPLAATTGFLFQYIFTAENLKRYEKNIYKGFYAMLGIIALTASVGVFYLPKGEMLYRILFSFGMAASGIWILLNSFRSLNFENAFYGVLAMMLVTGLSGMPLLDRMFSGNPELRSLTLLKQQPLKLYTFDEYAPEVWFRYQSVLPAIQPDKPSTIPTEQQFLVATVNPAPNALQPLRDKGWKLTFIGKFDDNEEGRTAKNYTGRKIHYVYKVQK